MFTVVKLGGCNGSGKTSVARKIITLTNGKASWWSGTKKNPNFYVGEYEGLPVMVLGSYATTCGGMDTISDKEERLKFVECASKPGRIVFFEGLITGKTYGRLGELSERHYKRKAGRWLYTFMDTPFDVCAARVLARRQEAGNLAPFDPERTMRSTFNSCQHLYEKLIGERTGRDPIPTYHHTMLLNHEHKPEVLAKQLLKEAGGIQNAGF